MKKVISILSFLVMAGLPVGAVDLTDISNDMAFPAAKSVINSNNSLTEVAIGSWQAGTYSGPTLTVDTNLNVGGVITSDKVVAKTTGATNAPLADLPENSFTFMEDFFDFNYTTNATITSTSFVFGVDSPWVYTGDGGVVNDISTAAARGGIVKIITGTSSNDEAYIQWGRYGTEGMFAITTNDGRQIWYRTYCNGPIVSPTSSVFFVGLAAPGFSAANSIVDTTGVMDTNKSYMGFICNSTYTNKYWRFEIHKADDPQTFVATNIMQNAGASDYRLLHFHWDGENTLTVGAAGTNSSRTFTISTSSTSYPVDTAMSPAIGVKTIFANYTPTNKCDFTWVKQLRQEN